MKAPRTAIAVIVLFLVSTAVFAQILTIQERKYAIEDTLNKGNYLVSLISLHPLSYFDSEKRDFFLRTLTEYTSYEGLAYLFVHDGAGQTLVSLAPSELASRIPAEIQIDSINTMGLFSQKFKLDGSKETIHEFAKPIFEKGKKVGTVRLGLKLPHISVFTLQRISFLAMIAFFLFIALFLGYWGLTRALTPLKSLGQRFRDTGVALDERTNDPFDLGALDRLGTTGGIDRIIQGFDRSLAQIRENMNQIEADNVALASKLGVITFEKNQIINIIDSINFGIIITDIQDNVGLINEYMLKLLNKKRLEVVDRALGEVLEHDEINLFISQQGTMEHFSKVRDIETTFPELAPGEIFQVSSSYLVDTQRTPIGKMISVKNITREKLAGEAQQGFIAHVAHELLTPLTNIKSYSEMLMEGEIDDTEMQKEFYNTINEETNRLATLIKNLLNISKMEVGSLTLDKGLVRTDWFVEGCLKPIEASAQEKNISIEKNLPDTFPSLLADKELLKNAIINLLGNALKYTPEKGHITFSISEQDDMVVFEITDDGYGISEEDLPHIFQKFYRASDSQVTQQVGSGLGLAITSDIVRLHDGEIEVESQLGKGSHFTIRIPKEEYHIGKQ
jgi:signal transduction histidine kinase